MDLILRELREQTKLLETIITELGKIVQGNAAMFDQLRAMRIKIDDMKAKLELMTRVDE